VTARATLFTAAADCHGMATFEPRATRRTALLGAAALLAGCSGTDDSASPTPDPDSDTREDTDGTTVSSDDLDLREANVTEVSVTDDGDGTYRFSVTLYHDVRKSQRDFRSPSEIYDF
jgi:hypothetical protein